MAEYTSNDEKIKRLWQKILNLPGRHISVNIFRDGETAESENFYFLKPVLFRIILFIEIHAYAIMSPMRKI
jgi:hypothetical protein